MKTRFALFAVLALFFVSCESYWAYKGAESAYASGRYTEASFRAAEALMVDRNNGKAVLLLEKSYPLAVNELLSAIRRTDASQDGMKWSAIADGYITLARLNDAVGSLQPLYLKKEKRTVLIALKEFPAETAAAREKAAEENYAQGLALMNSAGRDAKKQAYEYFSRCQAYVPGYRDAASRAEESRLNATCRILVTPTEEKHGQTFSLNPADIVYESLLSTVSRGIAGKSYSQIVDRGQIDRIIHEQELQLSDLFEPETALNVGNLLGANTLLLSQVTGIVYEPPQVTVTVRKITKTVPQEPGKAVQREPAKAAAAAPEKALMREVSGTLTCFTGTSSVKVFGSYRFIDAETSGIISSEAFTCEKKDVQNWAQYSGDDEALEDEDRRLIGNTPKTVSFDSLLLEAAKDLGTSIGRSVLSRLD